MASKSQTMFNGVQSGRVGSVVGFKRDDASAPQGVRPYVQPSNPKTREQARQRARFAGVAVLMSMLSQISDHNIEGERVGRWNRRAYAKLLFGDVFASPITAKGAGVVALANTDTTKRYVKVSKGTLGTVTPETVAEVTPLGVLTAESIEEAGLKVGDIVTIVIGRQGTGNLAGVSYKQYQIAEGVEVDDLNLVFDGANFTAQTENSCFGVIIERNGETKHLLTTSSMGIVPMYNYQTTEQCYQTYMSDGAQLSNNQFLYGEDFEENPSPAAVIGLRNLTINGESLAIGGTRQIVTTAALSGDVEVYNFEEGQELVAALGNYSKGDAVIPGSAIGQMGHGTIPMSHAAFGTAGSKQIWLIVDGFAYKKICNLSIVEPPFETSITNLSVDGNAAAQNAQVTIETQNVSISGNLSAYAEGHVIGVGFSTSNMVTASGTAFSGTLNNVPTEFTKIKLFVDGVAVEDWCDVKTTYVPPVSFDTVTLDGDPWTSNETSLTPDTYAIAGNVVGNAPQVALIATTTKPSVGASVAFAAQANISNSAFSLSQALDGRYYLVAGTVDAQNNVISVAGVFDYYLETMNE